MPARRTPAIDRLIENCEWEEECLVWQGSGPRQYGTIWSHEHGRKVYVHRLSYETFVGEIPDGLEIDHVWERGCRSKKCILPDHLEPVTHTKNRNRGRLEWCRAGRHDLTDPDNVRWDDAGNRRGCVQCHREKARARYYAGR